jgi:hypothetical protein
MICPHCKESVVAGIPNAVSGQAPTAMVLNEQDKAMLIENDEETLPKAKKTPTMNIMEAHEK